MEEVNGDANIMTMPRPGQLGFFVKLAYGTGHILNDMCASMWFTYLLIYFHSVLQFDNTLAGLIMLSGQIADGLSTLFVGFFMDAGDNFWLCNRYGKRKSWHLVGTLCVLAAFPFIFMPCIDCQDTDQRAQLVYYIAFVVIFQFGWAATQISHLSMIPVMTSCEEERNSLTSRRYAATVMSNASVFALTGALLGFGGGDQTPHKSVGLSSIGPTHVPVFRSVALACVGAGGLMSLIFHLTVRIKEEDSEREETPTSPLITHADLGTDQEDLPDTDHNAFPEHETPPIVDQRFVRPMKVMDWLKEPQFYQVAFIYMATRLYINVSQAYMPLYIQHSLQLPAVSIAVIPLIMFISGFVVSIVNKPISKFVGRKWSMIGGCLVGVAGAVWVQFGSLTDESFTKYEIYAISVLIGAAGSQMLITSLCIVADLISNNLDSSAFVYGCMSLVDKFSNGITIMAIQKMTPNPCGCPKEINFYSNALVWTCCAAALLGLVAVGSLLPATIGSRKRDQRSVNVNEVIQRDPDPELVQQEHVET